MTVFVTGAGGFLGTHVVAELLDRGQKVRALLRPASGPEPHAWGGRAQVVRADLRARLDADALDGIGTVVHLAATVRGTPEVQFAGTVVATERLIEGLRRTSSVRRIVLASSFSVYDWGCAGGVLDEDTALEPLPFERDGYTLAKLWQERVVRRAALENGWSLAVLRPGFIYGPGGAVAAGAGMALGRAFIVIGPRTRLPMTQVRNCARAFADAAASAAWRYVGALRSAGIARCRLPVPYALGLGVAHLASFVSRILFPPSGGKLPGILVPRRYRARFRPLRFANARAKEGLGWRCDTQFSAASAVP